LVRIESDGRVAFYVHQTNTGSDYFGLTSIVGDITGTKWQHVVCTVQQDRVLRIYVDGVLRKASNPLTSVWTPQSGTISLAGNYTATSGSVDEYSMYDYALTDEQVAAHFAAGALIPSAVTPEAASMGVDVPHFTLPFHFAANGHGTLGGAVAEQESTAEVAACCEAIIRTVQGQRTTLPEFGRPELEFATNPDMARTAIQSALVEFEPRVESLVSSEVDELDPELQIVRALIAPRDMQEGEAT
jgi:phage baseplate assembly protein W